MAIPCHNSHVDLGITVYTGLSFEQRVKNIVSKARQRLSSYLISFFPFSRLQYNEESLYYLRPSSIRVLFYCGDSFPCLIHIIDLIENV